MTVENPTGVTPSKNHTVSVVAKNVTDSPVIFLGYIIEVDAKKRDNGITMMYELDCADMKVRLQKSVLDVDVLAGTDTDILSGLLNNAYPDLSSLFDFSTNATDLFSDLELSTANLSVLDALNNLADLTGVSDWSLAPPESSAANGDPILAATFDGDDLDPLDGDYYYTSGNTSGWNGSKVGNGNGGRSLDLTLSDFCEGGLFGLSNTTIDNVSFDIYLANPSDFNIELRYGGGTGTLLDTYAGSNISADTWTTISWADDIDNAVFPVTSTKFVIRIQATSTALLADVEVRLDNIKYWDSYSVGNTKTAINWDDTPPLSDFDIDIDLADEFAFDIDLKLGDFADFNSVTVIGGFEDDPIDWTYESDGDLNHFDLELPIDDIVVYKNTGTDVTPAWTLQTLGEYGKDELTVDGGSKDVLYDAEYHWLLFNSNPSNLSKSIRVTGNIKKPVRIRVNEVPDGEPVFATTIQNDGINSVDDAVAIGQSILEKQNSIRSLNFKTYEPSLKVGQSIDVVDSSRGLDETIVIKRIRTRWLGASGHAVFDVFCGDDSYTGVDTIIANNDKRSRQLTARASISTPTIIVLTDDSGVYLTDDDGTLLYYEE